MGANKKLQTVLVVEPSEEESCSEQGTVSTFLQSRIHESFTRAADQLYAMNFLSTEERIAISSCIGDALEAFTNIMAEKVPSASEIEVPMEVAQEILRNAILHVFPGQARQGILRVGQEELGAPISSEYLDLPDRDQDHRTLRELIELALIDEVNTQQHYDNMLDVVYGMDLLLDADLPTRKALEEIFDDERDHEKILLRMLGEPVPKPGLADAIGSSSVASHAFDKCVECNKPPEYEILWANGKGHTWFCESHAKEFVKEHDAGSEKSGFASDVNSVKKIDDGKAHVKFADNTHGNILSEFRKTITAARHAFDKCMECNKPPEYEMLWMGGRAHAWFCEKHLKEFVDGEHDRKNGSDIPWIKEVMEGKALKNPTENTNPDISSRFVKKSSSQLPETEAKFFEELVRVSGEESFRFDPNSTENEGKTAQREIRTGDIDIPRTLAVDLDGTILEYDGFKGVGVFGNPIDGAREALQRFKEDGWFIVIDTCRGEVPQVIEHLILFDIPFDSVNEHPFQPSTANPGKPIAEYRIDDSAIHFDGDWTLVYDEVGRREQRELLGAIKIAWRPPIEKKIALQELSDELSDSEWLDVLPYTTEITGDSVALSRRVGMDTYRMIRCGGEYRAFRNFDQIYRSGGLFNEQELLESFEAAINSEDPETVESILRGYESYLLSKYRGHGFNNPEQWINITGTVIDGNHRIIYVEADPRSFGQYNEPPIGDSQSLLILLKKVADGAFAYDPQTYILLDFLDPFGNRAQPTDYPDPALWGEPEELKKRVRKRRQRDRGELAEQLDKMRAKKLLDIFVKEKL